jgi:hypothetical protein
MFDFVQNTLKNLVFMSLILLVIRPLFLHYGKALAENDNDQTKK